jgi:lambda repressor-like predicted transcriptional regulator
MTGRAKKIKKLLIDKGMTMAELAYESGYSRVHTSYVVNGHFKSKKAREAIARVLDVKPHEIWV